MEDILLIIFGWVTLFTICFIAYHFKWIVEQIRDIANNEGGYVKLIQFLFILLILTSFFLLLLYHLWFNETTSKLDIAEVINSRINSYHFCI
mgnify:CR=1 FL=1